MDGFAERKVPNGKLVKVTIRFEHTVLEAHFFGDFFLHPEETLEAIEQLFVGLPAQFDSNQTENRIQQLLEKKNAQLIGLSPSDFAAVAQEAIRNGRNE